jgi:hypothetical protein
MSCGSTDKNACYSVRGIAEGLHYIHEMGSDTVMRFVMIMLTVNLKNQSAHDDGITISVKPII